MLDAKTKRKIDNCRDILVGKIPDPKSQVEQITIALIYKFMDDMDQESIYMGGKPSFFTAEFEKYSWSSIFDPRISGFELLNLYGEALVKMNHNPNIPQLFRDIFKNAFLPYRDPETLRLFLKEIRGFTYDHSERLGDAFEYLLSVLSSQGEAGQFRTPRHIIDFIVKTIDPQLNHTILDPACGTAGFLISAYKHILKNNPKLSITKKKRLMNNFVGYDISADMVRLSLVNMYLHGFSNPKIHEYDTLTYEDKWNDTFDVIMANPPFMSPKGGIRPHSRFSVKAKRSEVLFVDYIAEHLNPGGRAGVIVPEGIIFQSQKAYKALRKMLVENYLWAVVSLPAGVFNPYSGVKTSILLMDKSLAKRIDKILFVKIENDGFDLGAQRRPIDKNDLPLAQKCLNIYKSKAETGIVVSVSPQDKPVGSSPFAHAVPKSEIAKSGDYNLSGDRYISFEHHKPTQWPLVELGDVCCQDRNQILPVSDEAHRLPYIGLEHIESDTGIISRNIPVLNDEVKSLTFAFDDRHVLYGKLRPYLNKVGLPDFSGRCSTEIIPLLPDKINRRLLAFILRRKDTIDFVMQNRTGTRMPRADIDLLLTKKIPLPPLEVQEKIVAEIDGYQKIIDGARQVVDNYKPTIKIDTKWPMVPLGQLAKNLDGKRIPITKSDRKKGKYPYYGASGIVDYVDDYIFDDDLLLISEDGANLLARVTPIAFTVSGKSWVNNHAHVLKFDNKETQIFVEIYLNSISLEHYVTGAAQPKLNQAKLNSIPIPLPSSSVQQEIVAQIKVEQEIVNANKKLIEIHEQKIKDKIAEVWGEI